MRKRIVFAETDHPELLGACHGLDGLGKLVRAQLFHGPHEVLDVVGQMVPDIGPAGPETTDPLSLGRGALLRLACFLLSRLEAGIADALEEARRRRLGDPCLLREVRGGVEDKRVAIPEKQVGEPTLALCHVLVGAQNSLGQRWRIGWGWHDAPIFRIETNSIMFMGVRVGNPRPVLDRGSRATCGNPVAKGV